MESKEKEIAELKKDIRKLENIIKNSNVPAEKRQLRMQVGKLYKKLNSIDC